VDTVITVTAIVAMIIVGMFLIHLLNAQHAERITAFHYSDALPGIGRRSRKGRRPSGPAAASPVVTTRPEHRDRGRG
jgi:hypothetical protein